MMAFSLGDPSTYGGPVAPCLQCRCPLYATHMFSPTPTLVEVDLGCPSCGFRVHLQGPAGFDVAAEIAAIRAGRQSPGINASVSVPTSAFASGGFVQSSAWHLSPGSREALPEPEPEQPGPELRAFSGSFVGYRAWKIRGWKLYGTGGIGGPWTPGINEAVCAVGIGTGPHPAPHQDCHCGLYALARFDDPSGWWQNADVLGAVEAWADPDDDGNHDRFFLHGTGFRAQYAKVILLATDDAYPRAKNAAVRALAAEHGADVCRREHLADAAREHGQLVPDDALKWAAEDDEGAFYDLAHMASLMGVPPSYFGLSAASVAAPPPSPLAPPLPGRKGIKQTLGHPGPPGHGQWRQGERVIDSRGQFWQCVKGGRPGSWGPEASPAP